MTLIITMLRYSPPFFGPNIISDGLVSGLWIGNCNQDTYCVPGLLLMWRSLADISEAEAVDAEPGAV